MQLVLPNISHPCKPTFPSWLEAKCWLGGNAAISHWNVRKIPENWTIQLRPQTNKTWQKQSMGLLGAGLNNKIYIYICMFNPRANFLCGVWSTVVNLNTYLLCLGALRAVPVPSAGKNCIQTHIFLVNSASEWVILQVTTPYPAKLPVNSVNSNRCRIHPDPKYEDRIFNLNMRICANQWKQGNFCKHACSLTIPVFFWFWYMLYISNFNKFQGIRPSKMPKRLRLWAPSLPPHT